MSDLIQAIDIHKSYGSLVVFDGASVVLSRSDRVGVIGRNGAGKSTLCRLILGEEELDAGEILISPGLRLGYLEQRDPFRTGDRVLDFLVRTTGREDWQCGRVAGRFQLKNEILQATIGELPGGFRTRVKLAAMLLEEPDFLLLDEPTNYLDLRTLILLEGFLRGFPGGYLIISHDREFLKRTCRQTLEVDRGRIALYPGNVEAFLEGKEQEREWLERQNRNVEQKRKQLRGFIDRYRVRAATASRAQSKIKQLERLETIEIEHPMSTASIRIPPVEARKGTALRCDDLSIGYAGRSVASGIHLEVERGEHVAVLGDNGQGKTTFLRTIAGELPPRDGSYRWGHHERASYYAQHVHRALDSELDVIGHLVREASNELTREDVLAMAGSFLFREEDIHKPIRVLSGGERARLCLAGLLLRRRPVLLLDEPTNHLDFETVEALGRALREYAGTLFFVSHDRTFVHLVATSVVEVRDGAVTLYPDGYETYVYMTEREVQGEVESRPEPARDSSHAASTAGPGVGESHFRRRKELKSRVNKLRRRMADLEADLERNAAEKEAIHAHFLENPMDYSPERRARADELTRMLEEAEATWLELGEDLEAAERELDGPQAP